VVRVNEFRSNDAKIGLADAQRTCSSVCHAEIESDMACDEWDVSPTANRGYASPVARRTPDTPPSAPTRKAASPLLAALNAQRVDMVEAALLTDPFAARMPVDGFHFRSPLCHAARSLPNKDLPDILALLIKAGACAADVDAEGQTALHGLAQGARLRRLRPVCGGAENLDNTDCILFQSWRVPAMPPMAPLPPLPLLPPFTSLGPEMAWEVGCEVGMSWSKKEPKRKATAKSCPELFRAAALLLLHGADPLYRDIDGFTASDLIDQEGEHALARFIRNYSGVQAFRLMSQGHSCCCRDPGTSTSSVDRLPRALWTQICSYLLETDVTKRLKAAER